MGSFFRERGDYAEFLRGGDIFGNDVRVEDHRKEVFETERVSHRDFGFLLVWCVYVGRRKFGGRGGGGMIYSSRLYWGGKGVIQVMGGPRRVEAGFYDLGGDHVVARSCIVHLLDGMGDILESDRGEEGIVIKDFVRFVGGGMAGWRPEGLFWGYGWLSTHNRDVACEFLSYFLFRLKDYRAFLEEGNLSVDWIFVESSEEELRVSRCGFFCGISCTALLCKSLEVGVSRGPPFTPVSKEVGGRREVESFPLEPLIVRYELAVIRDGGAYIGIEGVHQGIKVFNQAGISHLYVRSMWDSGVPCCCLGPGRVVFLSQYLVSIGGDTVFKDVGELGSFPHWV